LPALLSPPCACFLIVCPLPLRAECGFNSPTLSVKDIRDLGGEEKYHTGEWQKECERTLAGYGIYPNDGLSEFTVSGKDKRFYSRDRGILSETNKLIPNRKVIPNIPRKSPNM
jgi:hypothetical protein